MRRCIFALAAVLVLAGAVCAQTAPRILAQADVDKFIRDFPLITKGLETAGSNFDEAVAESQDDPAHFSPSTIRSLLARAQTSAAVRETLEKYGWNDKFWDVYYVIYIGVYVSMMDQALIQYPSPELKAQVDVFRASIHRDDHTLVLRNLEALLAVFEASAVE